MIPQFRGLGIETNKWHYGFAGIMGEEVPPLRSRYNWYTLPQYVFHTIIQTPLLDGKGQTIGYSWSIVHPETVGQFIGLTDKNNVEIYEGDVVKHGYTNHIGDFYENGIVGFVVNDGAYEIATNEPYLKRLTILNVRKLNIEVIGNIHDNPELLEG